MDRAQRQSPRSDWSSFWPFALTFAATTLTELDGVTLPGDQARIPLADDGGIHHVRVVLG